MQEQIILIKEMMLGIWSKKHYIIIVTWLICPLAWFSITLMPDQYESEARVYVDTQSLLRPLMKGLMVETDPNIQIQLMVKTLLSRPNLERIARMNDLDLNVDTSEQFERVIDSLENKIEVSRTGRENIFTISSSQANPELAQNIVQSALTVFIENTLGESRQDSDTAQKFLDQQINEYELRLIAAETRLKNFKQKYHSSLPENARDYTGALAINKGKLKEAELKLLEAQTRLDSARAQLNGQKNLQGDGTGSGIQMVTQFDERIKQLQADLDTLSLRFTDQHPDVKELKRRLEQLNIAKSEEIEQFKAASQDNPDALQVLNENPVYQEMKIQVNELENDVASLTVRVEDYKNRIAILEQQILTIPEVDAEFMSLNRDYSIVKKRYEELLNRQESAQLAQQAERSTEKIQFRVIDPPKFPIEPTGPKRTLFAILAFVASIVLGLGLSFLLNSINPKVISASQLTRETNLPIFGIVSANSNLGIIPSLKRKKRLFLASNLMLTLMLFGLISYYHFSDQLLPYITRFF
ncbi:XrtA system polysaccharide chain length determinant [Thalassotalea aquiviva]|uniref:XrtA system polysaccharide chain length determinant n=1 Tax=Thalassotalea aquiviva TaxID=3242415 RepID=UPI00352B0A54